MNYQTSSGDKDMYEISCMHTRQLEVPDKPSPFLDDAPTKITTQMPQTTDGEGDDDFCKYDIERRLESNSMTKGSNDICKSSVGATSESISQFWWINSNSISEAAAHLSFFPEYFESVYPVSRLHQSNEIRSPSADYPHQKSVSIGQAHQASIPEFSIHGFANSSDLVNDSNPLFLVDTVNEEKWMGTCVVPMPDIESMEHFSEGVKTSTLCKCPDGGSTRCVRDSVREARKNLKESLGPETFKRLGFCEMGEEVADKWTEEEERSFHQIVVANPASLGSNFWHQLSSVFPSRPHEELVSYYFNVFILRKRAKQNRVDPLNIDSDNDEWQETSPAMVEEDGDSVVESPSHIQTSVDYCNEEEDDIDGCTDGTSCRVETDEEYGEYVDNTCGEVVVNCLETSEFKSLNENPKQKGEDVYGEDDSCTSYEYQQDIVE